MNCLRERERWRRGYVPLAVRCHFGPDIAWAFGLCGGGVCRFWFCFSRRSEDFYCSLACSKVFSVSGKLCD
jgi:hypothetical protein